MALEGTTLGRYRIVRLLGSGGMGDVYLAEDPRIGQQAAIKVIRAEQSPYPNAPAAQEAVRLFQREARAIVKLDHPHILPLNDYGESQLGEQTLIYLVMPYRPEGSLVRWVQQHYPDRLVPPAVVAHILRQAAQAIQHAHDHQIIHQDVKPSNFLLRERKEDPNHPDILLADFGIARLATTTASVSQSIRGTPTYMAPEQCVGEAVPASDQYALAVTAYELLTGRPPFQGNSMRIMFQHVNTPPEPPSTLNPRLSKELDDLILTALSKRPEERFRSVTAFANAFQQAIQSLEIADAFTLIRPASAPMPDTESHITSTANLASTILPIPPTEITPPTASTNVLGTPTLPTAMAPTIPPGVIPGYALPTDPNILNGQTIPLPGMADGGTENQSNAGGEQASAGLLPPTLALPAGSRSSTGALSAATRTSRAHRKIRKGRFVLFAAAVLIVLVLVLGGVAYAVLAAPNATVTITPASKEVNNTFTLSAVTGTPDATKQQVGTRLVSATTLPSMKTVNATGQRTIQATHATGTLRVYNDMNTVTVTITAGTSFPNGTSAGPAIHMIIDQTITLTDTQNANVPGHVSETGTIGNISPGEFDYLSPAGYEVNLYSPFTGGQDYQMFTTVAQSDIDNAAKALESANMPDPAQVLQYQIHPNEQLVGTPQCTPNVTSDHQAGDRATQVTVSVTFACTGEIYDHDGAVALATQMLMDQAAIDPGAGYALVGKIKATVTNATITDAKQGTVTLMVSADGVWAYQFTDAQKQALARLIAGKNTQDAQRLLTGQSGVASASIKLSGLGNTLPSDPSKIKIVVQASAGA